jgi:hypothetical protein
MEIQDSQNVGFDEALRRVDLPDLFMVKKQLGALGWPRYLANEVEIEYRRFLLLLLLNPGERLMPAPLIDAFWRQHIENTQAYEEASSHIFGSHFDRMPVSPDFSENEERDRNQTKILYEKTFPGWEMTYWQIRWSSRFHDRYYARQKANSKRATTAVDTPSDATEPVRTVERSERSPVDLALDIDTETLTEQLERHRFVHLQRIFPPETTDALSSEADALKRSAREFAGHEYNLGGNGRVSSPSVHLSARPGARLRAIHEDLNLLTVLRKLTGRPLLPTRASYIFYRAGDFIGLHTDVSPCGLTLISSVLGRTEPLVLHPELQGLTPEQLYETTRQSGGQPEGGLLVDVPVGGALALLGSRVPHNRPLAKEQNAIATLCYAAIG